MTTTPAQRARNTRLIRGQKVILNRHVFVTVVDFPTEEHVRVCFPDGAVSVRWQYEIQTRAEALHSARHLMARIAADLDDLGLMDAMEQSAVYVELATQRADAADAVRGLS